MTQARRVAGVALLLQVLLLTTCQGQEQVERRVVSVEFQGLQTVKLEALKPAVRTTQGAVLKPEQLEADMAAILALGVFNPDPERTRVNVSEVEGGVKIVFQLTENPRLTAVTFEGNQIITTDQLKAAVGDLLVEGEIYNSVLASRAVDRIVEAYTSAGYEAIVSSGRIDEQGRLVLTIVEARIGSVTLNVTPPVTVNTEALQSWLAVQPGTIFSRSLVSGLARRLRDSGLFAQVDIPPPVVGDDISKITLAIQGTCLAWPHPSRESIGFVDVQKAVDAVCTARPVPAENWALELPLGAEDIERAEEAFTQAPADLNAAVSLAVAYFRASPGARAASAAGRAADSCAASITPASPPGDRAAYARLLILAQRWDQAYEVAAPLLDAPDPTLRGLAALVEVRVSRLAQHAAALAAGTPGAEPVPDGAPLEWAVEYLNASPDPTKLLATEPGRDYVRAVTVALRQLRGLDPAGVCAQLDEFRRLAFLLNALNPINSYAGFDTEPRTPITTALADPRVMAGLRTRSANPEDRAARYGLARLLMIHAFAATLSGSQGASSLGFGDTDAVKAAAAEAAGIFQQLLKEDPSAMALVRQDVGLCLILQGKAPEGRQWLYQSVADGKSRQALGVIYDTTRPDVFLVGEGAPTPDEARAAILSEVREFCAAHQPLPPGLAELLVTVAVWNSDWATADQTLEPLVAAGQETADSLALLGFVRLKEKRWPDAVGALERSAQLSGSSATKDALGLAYLAAGRADDALKQWEASPKPKYGNLPL